MRISDWSSDVCSSDLTLFQLAERFYDPQAGEIRLDGVALTDADPAAIRARIAMVPQETMIFAASARDNLRYGNRSEEHTSELQSLMRISYAVFCLKKKKKISHTNKDTHTYSIDVYMITTKRLHS